MEHNDAEMLLAFYTQNQNHLQPWETLPGCLSELTLKITDQIHEQNKNRGLYLLIFVENSLSRMCNFSSMIFGAFQACFLGFKIGEAFQGFGYMHEALCSAIPHIFDVYKLHRIMANYIPKNLRSQKLLTNLNFEKEGYAKDYLMINGTWKDHVLTSLTKKSSLALNPAAPLVHK